MKYNIATAARILEEALPPEYWANALLCPIDDEETTRQLAKAINRKSDVERAEIGELIRQRLADEDVFLANNAVQINVRGVQLPSMINKRIL